MNVAATITGAAVTLTALAVARICMARFEAEVVASEKSADAGDRRRHAELARKWRRRLQLAATGDRRTVDAVIRWL